MQMLAPIQERRRKYEDNPQVAWEILEDGSERARKAAEATHGRGARGMHM